MAQGKGCRAGAAPRLQSAARRTCPAPPRPGGSPYRPSSQSPSPSPAFSLPHSPPKSLLPASCFSCSPSPPEAPPTLSAHPCVGPPPPLPHPPPFFPLPPPPVGEAAVPLAVASARAATLGGPLRRPPHPHKPKQKHNSETHKQNIVRTSATQKP